MRRVELSLPDQESKELNDINVSEIINMNVEVADDNKFMRRS